MIGTHKLKSIMVITLGDRLICRIDQRSDLFEKGNDIRVSTQGQIEDGNSLQLSERPAGGG